VARKVRHLSSLGQKLGSLQVGLSARSCRRLAGAALAIQILGAVVAASTHLMLHGDGAYFVYALSVGQPWPLKWATIAPRIAVYITTVVPTEWIAWGLHLSPLAIADLNGFIFYLVPTLLYVGACTLVWRRSPQYLVFPVAQYILSTSLGFGYPSEILLAPGFLWICLFLTLGDRTPNVFFFISLLGLIFSHELAIPSAFVAILLAQQARAKDVVNSEHWRFALVAIASASVLALFVWVCLTRGSAAYDPNYAIDVFDPRKIFANPTMWLMINSMVVAIVLFSRFASSVTGPLGWGVVIAPAATIPILLKFAVPSFDFDQGRYQSARTIIAGVMFFLAIAFALLRARIDEPLPASPRAANASVFVLAVALAVSAGAEAAFVIDWTIALRGLRRVVTTTVAEHAPKFVAFDDMPAYLTPDEVSAFNRIGFFWACPYRSIILADGREPTHIVYDSVDFSYRDYCRKAHVISKERSRIPAATLDEMQNFACNHIPPPPKHLRRDKVMALVRSFINLLTSSHSRGN
jgi:hypothetical protein